MKKNILIIGYGDLGKRLTDILDRNLYNFFHVSRNNKYNSDDFIEWDWSSKKEFEKNFKQIDVVIFFPQTFFE
jgi:lactate dehydrogenase-like 2-hydroxyacid dehydrogenase